MVAQSVGANRFVKNMTFLLSLEHGKVESGIALSSLHWSDQL